MNKSQKIKITWDMVSWDRVYTHQVLTAQLLILPLCRMLIIHYHQWHAVSVLTCICFMFGDWWGIANRKSVRSIWAYESIKKYHNHPSHLETYSFSLYMKPINPKYVLPPFCNIPIKEQREYGDGCLNAKYDTLYFFKNGTSKFFFPKLQLCNLFRYIYF